MTSNPPRLARRTLQAVVLVFALSALAVLATQATAGGDGKDRDGCRASCLDGADPCDDDCDRGKGHDRCDDDCDRGKGGCDDDCNDDADDCDDCGKRECDDGCNDGRGKHACDDDCDDADDCGDDCGKGKGRDKVSICHAPPGNPGNAHTITIGAPAVDAHLRNHPGDSLGACAGCGGCGDGGDGCDDCDGCDDGCSPCGPCPSPSPTPSPCVCPTPVPTPSPSSSPTPTTPAPSPTPSPCVCPTPTTPAPTPTTPAPTPTPSPTPCVCPTPTPTTPAPSPSPSPAPEEEADVSVEKTAEQDEQAVVFTVTVRANGPGDSQDVVLTDALVDTSDEWLLGGDDSEDCEQTALLVQCDFGTLEAGETRQVTLKSYIDELACGEDLVNVASVDSSNDADASNNEDNATIEAEDCAPAPSPSPSPSPSPTPCVCPSPAPEEADVSVSKEVADQDNETVTFRITVSSVGDATAENVSLSDELPAVSGDWFLSGADADACSLDGNTLACDFGDLSAGESRSVDLRGYIRGVCDDLVNTASVAADNDSDASNNEDTVTVEMECAPAPPPEEADACAFTPGYWKNHPEAWPDGAVADEDAAMAMLSGPSGGDASAILGRHLVAAQLNLASGATGAEDLVEQAEALLAGVDGAVAPSSTEGAQMVQLAERLAAFNEQGCPA